MSFYQANKRVKHKRVSRYLVLVQKYAYALFNTPGLTKRPDSIHAEGRPRWINDIVVTTTDNAAADEIKILAPPKGALIDKSRSFIEVAAAPASTVTVDIGFEDDKDAITDNTDVATTGTIPLVINGGSAGAELVEKTDDNQYLVLTLNTMTTPAAGTMRVAICYYVR